MQTLIICQQTINIKGTVANLFCSRCASSAFDQCDRPVCERLEVLCRPLKEHTLSCKSMNFNLFLSELIAQVAGYLALLVYHSLMVLDQSPLPFEQCNGTPGLGSRQTPILQHPAAHTHEFISAEKLVLASAKCCPKCSGLQHGTAT